MNRTSAFHTGQLVIHVDMGEVTVVDFDDNHVRVADETGDTVHVPADEIC